MKRSTTVGVGFELHPEFRYVMDGELYARLSTAGRIFRYLPVSLADFQNPFGESIALHGCRK